MAAARLLSPYNMRRRPTIDHRSRGKLVYLMRIATLESDDSQ